MRISMNNKKRRFKNYIFLIISFVFVVDIFLFNLIKDNLGYNIAYTAKLKIEELTHLNSTIQKYLNIDTNDYIRLNLVNNSIVNVDIDNTKCNILLNNI